MPKELEKVSATCLMRVAAYGFLLTGIYWSTYSWLVKKDWTRDDYSASALIPLVVLYLVWEKRAELFRRPSSSSWAGLWIMIVGIALFWLGELGGEFFSLYFSSWLLLAGLCWLHLGWEKIKTIAFPLLLLLGMFPLPNFIHGKLSFNLKLLSSQIGVKMMQWMGMTAYREGNVIDLGFTQLQVVDACSGLRYLIPLIILGLLIAYSFKAVWWKRVLLVISAIPIAVLANSLRIASVGVLYQFWGPMVAEGFFHDFSGWFIFMLTVGFLVLFMGLLRALPPRTASGTGIRRETTTVEVKDETAKPADNGALSGPLLEHALFSPHFLTACGLLVLTLAISMIVDFHEKTPIRKKLTSFPSELSGWRGTRQSIEQKFIDSLDLSDYLITEFRNEEGRSVSFYVAYYESQRKGESIHSPATCMPGGGWEFRESGETEISFDPVPSGSMQVKRAFMQKGEAKQLAYFWFPMRGRILTNAYQMKLYNMWDALTRQRTDGALVRLVTPVYPDEAISQTEDRLQTFVKDVVPVLGEYLPQ